jgi:hypothetical protein
MKTSGSVFQEVVQPIKSILPSDVLLFITMDVFILCGVLEHKPLYSTNGHREEFKYMAESWAK